MGYKLEIWIKRISNVTVWEYLLYPRKLSLRNIHSPFHDRYFIIWCSIFPQTIIIYLALLWKSCTYISIVFTGVGITIHSPSFWLSDFICFNLLCLSSWSISPRQNGNSSANKRYFSNLCLKYSSWSSWGNCRTIRTAYSIYF